jgi:hypothetical protein
MRRGYQATPRSRVLRQAGSWIKPFVSRIGRSVVDSRAVPDELTGGIDIDTLAKAEQARADD